MLYKVSINYYIVTALLIVALLIPTTSAENEVEKTKELTVGMVAPEFKLKDETGKERSISEYLGKKNVVLAFYPKDFTGG